MLWSTRVVAVICSFYTDGKMLKFKKNFLIIEPNFYSPEHGPMRVQLTNPVSRFKHIQSLQHMCRYVYHFILGLILSSF